MKINTKKCMMAAVLLIVGILSFAVVAGYAASPDYHKNTITSLDDKKTTVLELTAATTTTSALITLLPGDTGTPIADKVADLSQYLLIVLCAVFLEKYLVTITGYVAFKILIPVACILFIITLVYDNATVKKLARRLIVFAIAIFLVVPASIKVSDLIENTYRSQIDAAIEEAGNTDGLIDDDDIKSDTDSSAAKDDKGFWNSIADSIKKAGSSVTNSVETVLVSPDKLVNKVQNCLNNFVEAIAVMIITSCVIPILVIIFFIWLVKVLLDVDLSKVKLPEKISKK